MKEISALDRADKLRKLRMLLSEGEASGEPAPFDIEDFIAEKKKSIARNQNEK